MTRYIMSDCHSLYAICAKNDFHRPISFAHEPGARLQMGQRKTSKRVSSTHEQAYKQMAPCPIFSFCLDLILEAMKWRAAKMIFKIL